MWIAARVTFLKAECSSFSPHSLLLYSLTLKLIMNFTDVKRCHKICLNVFIMLKICAFMQICLFTLLYFLTQNIQIIYWPFNDISHDVTHALRAAGAGWLEPYGCCHWTPLPLPSLSLDPLKTRWPQHPPSPLSTELHAKRARHAC